MLTWYCHWHVAIYMARVSSLSVLRCTPGEMVDDAALGRVLQIVASLERPRDDIDVVLDNVCFGDATEHYKQRGHLLCKHMRAVKAAKFCRGQKLTPETVAKLVRYNADFATSLDDCLDLRKNKKDEWQVASLPPQ